MGSGKAWVRCGLAAALLGSTAVTAGMAASAAAETVQVAQAGGMRAFNIPAGPLGAALTAFGEAAGLKLLVPTDLLRDRRSAGVSGTLAPDRALGQLLAGTGLTWRYTESGTVTVEPVIAQGDAMQLAPVSVEGQAQSTAGGLYTEGTHSYGSRVASVGSKAPVSLREVPQSISVVTRQRMDDQNMTRLEDAMRKTTGMTVLTNDGGRSSIFSRGFELDQYMVDGMPTTLSSQMGTQPDLAMFDHIEVLRGPAGLFSGSGEPGGSVNLLRKRARDTFGGSASATVGSWNSYRAEADASVPLVESKAIRARAVASYQEADSFVNVTSNQSTLGYGTVEFDLDPNTTLSLAASRQERDMVPNMGLPAYANGQLLNVDRSTFLGATWNRFDSTATEAFAELEHRLDDGGFVKGSLRHTDRDSRFKYAYGTTVSAANTFGMSALDRQYDEQALALDLHASKPVEAWGQTHNVVAGIDYRRSDQRLDGGVATISGVSRLSTFNPAAVTQPNIPYTNARTDTTLSQYSAYSQVRIKPVTPLTVVLGGRFGSYKVELDNLLTNRTTVAEKNGEFTPYAGLVWDFHNNLSAYVSQTEVLQPQTNTSVGSVLLKPQTGEQREIGVKGEFMDGRLTSQLALFQAEIKNRAVADSANTGFNVAADVETSGLEAEIAGTVVPGWEVYAGYAYLLSEYTSRPEGQTYNSWTPKHTLTLSTKYTFDEGALTGFSVGGGVRAVSSYFGQATGTAASGTRWYQNGYQVFDAQLGYKLTENLDATFSVNNILDETYYSRVASASTFNYYGEPRSFWLKVGATF